MSNFGKPSLMEVVADRSVDPVSRLSQVALTLSERCDLSDPEKRALLAARIEAAQFVAQLTTPTPLPKELRTAAELEEDLKKSDTEDRAKREEKETREDTLRAAQQQAQKDVAAQDATRTKPAADNTRSTTSESVKANKTEKAEVK